MIAITLLLAASTQAVETPPAREKLVAASIQWMRRNLPDPPSTQFRRVFVRKKVSASGSEEYSICGQALQNDARAPIGWRAFTGAIMGGGEIYMMLGRGLAGDAADLCRPLPAHQWDYDHDLSARFTAELSKR